MARTGIGGLGLRIGVVAIASSLAACGGGGGDARVRSATVDAITADSSLSFDSLATFSVAGANLDVGVNTTASGCAGVSILSGTTSTAFRVSCTPSRDGEITLSVNAAGGALLKSSTFNVPKPQVRVTTSLGTLLIELEAAKAPITVRNFLKYVQEGFYVNTVFHRIVNTFVAQAGGFTFSNGYSPKQPTQSAIALERTTVTDLSNVARTIAMARTSTPDSATSQFFINLQDNLFLNAQNQQDSNGYAVFGAVITTAEIDSDATLAALKAVPVVNNGAGEVSLPLLPPLITAATRVR